MNNYYKKFFLNKIESYTFLDEILLILFLLFIFLLIFSIITFVNQNINKNKHIRKLINFEKNLIKLKKSYNDGQINAQVYKERVNNLKKKFNI